MASAEFPKVVQFGFTNYESTPKSRSVKCRTCGVKITYGVQTTSNFNFVGHLEMNAGREVNLKQCVMNINWVQFYISGVAGGGRDPPPQSLEWSPAGLAQIWWDCEMYCPLKASLYHVNEWYYMLLISYLSCAAHWLADCLAEQKWCNAQWSVFRWADHAPSSFKTWWHNAE